MSTDTISSRELAERLGVSHVTVWRWQSEDPKLAQCVVRRTRHSTRWSVQRLRESGYLTASDAPAVPALSYSLRIAK